MKEDLDIKDSIRAYSGNYINIFNVDPKTIKIEDIAHGLSMQCRFGGHTKEFHSVAEHSIWVCNNVITRYKFQALMHDASEAYLLDMPSPIKANLGDYKIIENILMEAISDKFKFKHPMDKKVREADRLALEWEWENKVLNNNFKSMSQPQAKEEFLKLYHELTHNKLFV